MKIKKLTILGKSDATITMILDNLESKKNFPYIEIINNLNQNIILPISNPKFLIDIKNETDEVDNFFLGVFKSSSKVLTIQNFNIPFEKYINIIHKTSSISLSTKLGYGCLINSLVSIAAHSTIGNFVSVNRNSSIGHHTILNDFVTVNPGVNIAGNVNIGEKTIVGMGSNIIDGITIGKNVIIGAGSLVTKNIPNNVVAYGSPCKIIRINETQ
jgi:sugar O-acyltransferase (sialic acid O-acetyltransferase NeuD family)